MEFDRRSWIDIEINVATAAENKPVYDVESTYKVPRKEVMRLTKTRIPSASAFQLSATLLSSSAAISKYMVNSGPDPSTKTNALCSARFWAD